MWLYIKYICKINIVFKLAGIHGITQNNVGFALVVFLCDTHPLLPKGSLDV